MKPSVAERFRLDDKVVVITGGSSGLGVAFAQACAESGADVVVAGRRFDRLQQTVALVCDIGREGVAVPADVATEHGCRTIVDTAVQRFGRIDVLVNNAGIEDHAPASRLHVDDFRRVLDVNVTGGFLLAQRAATVMPHGSSIVNVGSVLAHTTIDVPTTAYSTSKAAILGLTHSLSRQWSGRKGIRVNALLPGWFPSEMTDTLAIEAIEQRLVMGRMGEPAELAAALVFLASDASSYMTGSELTVDGGFRLT
ncbi:SDR family NAD(P)-dependent oxidoreductase [Mycolicibacterium austroafricanum]|uniref:SDR family NAD(P)-dependent oxidoreductase n=1 Tax=Mycolicibacterium austroafricanum TaxID=39687 RepID=UPI003AF37EAE